MLIHRLNKLNSSLIYESDPLYIKFLQYINDDKSLM